MQFFGFSHRSLLLRIIFLGLLFTSPTLAQDEELEQPVYLTVRLFEVRVPPKQEPLTNQVFRLRTSAQADDEKWLSNIKKAYPTATEVALLRTSQFRLFRRPRPGVIVLGDPKVAHIEAQFVVAQGLRDDDTINTTALSEVNYYAGPRSTHPIPLSMTNHGFEVEPGMTYFYTSDGVRLRSDVYAQQFRDGSGSPEFSSFEPYLVISLSCEETKHVPFVFDEIKTKALQEKATKKSEPKWPEAIKKQGLFGKVSVRAEITPEGKVSKAAIWQSTLPEGNRAALDAALQWEFPSSELAGINAPASALFTFAVAPPPKAAEAPKPESVPSGVVAKPEAQAKPAETKSTAKKPPVKRQPK